MRVGREPQVLLYELADFLYERVEACAFFIDDWRTPHERHKRTISVLNADRCRAFATFDDNLDLAVLLLLRLENAAERSDPVDLFGAGLVNGGVVLSG